MTNEDMERYAAMTLINQARLDVLEVFVCEFAVRTNLPEAMRLEEGFRTVIESPSHGDKTAKDQRADEAAVRLADVLAARISVHQRGKGGG